ncbi:hypothetical protein EVA_10672 [gut metagenome]|uniref:Uncharacterized protein n=1 Tax=gut metagenome TaxID=749906 RepID=J9CM98_9ZZZZ
MNPMNSKEKTEPFLYITSAAIRASRQSLQTLSLHINNKPENQRLKSIQTEYHK